MSNPAPTIVFIPLALNQVAFYIALGEELRRDGAVVAFISLHEPSVHVIRGKGFHVLNFYEALKPLNTYTEDTAANIARRYGIANVNQTIVHEKAAYDIRSSFHLLRKLAAYTDAMDGILGQLVAHYGHELEIVQELGGFLSVISAFRVTQARGLTNTFIEPAFFRSRVFFLRNTVSPVPVVASQAVKASREMVSYLERTVRDHQIVIPVKDAAHFRSALRKVLDPYKLRRLAQKSVEKYLLKQREEFSHIRMQVARHARMLLNERLLRRYYRYLPEAHPFVYYPLHVAADVGLTLRAPEYLDQYGLIDYLARNIPITHLLVVKEHPAMVGGVSYLRIRELMARHDNVVLLWPSLNNFEVMRRAAAIVTVNSKSGAEAILLNRPVLALGDSFYRSSGLVTTVGSWAEIPEAIQRVVEAAPRREDAIIRFFQAVWDRSYPGELYDERPENCRVFAHSLLEYLSRSSPEAIPDEPSRVTYPEAASEVQAGR